MVFPDSDYDGSALSVSGGTYTFTHQAFGADKFRYSANFGQNWTDWQPFEATSTLQASLFQDKANFWKGDHVMVQCELGFFLSLRFYFYFFVLNDFC